MTRRGEGKGACRESEGGARPRAGSHLLQAVWGGQPTRVLLDRDEPPVLCLPLDTQQASHLVMERDDGACAEVEGPAERNTGGKYKFRRCKGDGVRDVWEEKKSGTTHANGSFVAQLR